MNENGRHFVDDISESIFVTENASVLNQISPKYVSSLFGDKQAITRASVE